MGRLPNNLHSRAEISQISGREGVARIRVGEAKVWPFPLVPFPAHCSRMSVSISAYLGLPVRKDRCPQDHSPSRVSEETLRIVHQKHGCPVPGTS